MVKCCKTIGVWQFFMLLLSVAALCLLGIQTFGSLDPSTADLLLHIDTFICVVFFADFVWQVIRSQSRAAYLKWGWLDLISSIPMFPAFRVARLARIVRIIRVMRGAKASKHMLGLILLHKARNTFAAVVLGSIVFLLFSSIAIVSVEPELSPREALWWCIFTVITGEYNDFYPNSTEGRVIAALLMTSGMAIFGTFTASLASFFLEAEQKEDEKRDTATLAELSRLTREITDLKGKITNREAPHDEHPQKDS